MKFHMIKLPLLAVLFALFSGALIMFDILVQEGAIAQTPSAQKVPAKKYGKKYSTAPLRGKSYYSYSKVKRKGYYSYRYADGINTRKFTDPTLNGQNAFGPLESDYFFSTPRPPIGGDSPYMH